MAENRTGKTGGRSLLSALLMVLFLAFALTSGMVGFLLGRNASRSTGELVDTIVLSPGDSSLRTSPVMHFLTGKVLYRGGSPCSGATVRLGDGDRTDVTDKQGKFYFSDLRAGEQVLEVLDGEGKLLASTRLVLDFSAESAVSADPAGEPPAFTMPDDARMLELTLTVEEDQSLKVKEDAAYFVTKDGQIVDFSGSSLKLRADSYAVTPSGNLVNPLGYVLLPSKEVVFTPEGSQKKTEPEREALPGVVVVPDGSAKTEEGVSLLPSGEVELPGGETLRPEGNKVVVIEGETAEKVEELPDTYVPSPPDNMSPPEDSSAPEPPQNMEEESSQEESSNSEQEESAKPTPTPEPTPKGLEVMDSHTGVSWKQQSTVDLFKNRTDMLNLGEENGIPLAAPGSQGYYEFRLENPEEFDIAYTIAIEERSFHLPILYSVVDASDNTNYLRREHTGSESDTLVSPEIRIPAGTTQEFRIEWEWQYEDWFDPEGDDALDMRAVSKRDRTYIVAVAISATQLDPVPVITPGDDTKYPGVRGTNGTFTDRLKEQRNQKK